MIKKVSTSSAVLLAALTLAACGGGGDSSTPAVTPNPSPAPGPAPSPAPAPAPVAVAFKWASLSQAIPAGKTSLDLPLGNCVDNKAAGAVLPGKHVVTITADGDVVYAQDGVEKTLVQYANRMQSRVTINGPELSAEPWLSGEMESPERVVKPQSARVQPAKIDYTVTGEYVHITTQGVRLARPARNLDVTCTLASPLLSNGTLSMDQVQKSVVPASNVSKMVDANGVNGLYMAYDMNVTPTRFRVGTTSGTISVMPLDAKGMSDHSQMFHATGMSVYGYSLTHWMSVRVQLPVNGTPVTDTFVIGFHGKDQPPTLRMSGGLVQLN